MLTTSANLWLGVLFVLIGAINMWLITQSSARVRDAKASARLIAAHRIGGYLFIALFCIMGYFMLARLGDVDGGPMLHMTLAMVLSPLLFVKVHRGAVLPQLSFGSSAFGADDLRAFLRADRHCCRARARTSRSGRDGRGGNGECRSAAHGETLF
jgi:hypothetical protein